MSSQSANLIWTPQVRWSLRWIRAFFAGVAGAPLVRTIRMRDRRTLNRWLVAVDASPWGLGGILLDQHRVIAAFEDRVQDDDLSRLNLRLGEAAGQSVLDALAARVAHRGAQTTDELMYDTADRPLERHPSFNSFRHEFELI